MLAALQEINVTTKRYSCDPETYPWQEKTETSLLRHAHGGSTQDPLTGFANRLAGRVAEMGGTIDGTTLMIAAQKNALIKMSLKPDF